MVGFRIGCGLEGGKVQSLELRFESLWPSLLVWVNGGYCAKSGLWF